ncbi:uncharacterized protein UV8b_04394 [Ustilaginoidea virens]|uniref:Uncharacterized protein n=1 Tax=Ustilaginoidea virens TaxID=1159556 RepID=A0A8E5HRP4_USTVR|nr:uncharacterized protein UV8b_04394 [Ustilaginoidea virens]QUC20153.1 hypothetical protein UV8b_04394 [Ustilaginoidea virens]
MATKASKAFNLRLSNSLTINHSSSKATISQGRRWVTPTSTKDLILRAKVHILRKDNTGLLRDSMDPLRANTVQATVLAMFHKSDEIISRAS